MTTTTKRTLCLGSGRPGAEGFNRFGERSLYPNCPFCGKEFSAQGRKHRYNQSNGWTALPKHYR